MMHINQRGAARLPACLPALHLQLFNAQNEAVQAAAVLQLQWEPNVWGAEGGAVLRVVGANRGRAQISKRVQSGS